LTAPVPEENLVLNPSFEAGEGDTFTSWSKSGVGEGYPGNLIEQDLTDYSDGQRAAKITNGMTSAPALYQYVPVTVGASYEVSFWGHSSAVDGIRLRVTGYIGGTVATDLVPRTTFGLGDSVWRRYARTFTVPPNYTHAKIIISSVINQGIVWIDNVRLRRIA
ncbi:MAG TPA: carbohydrate binding domain-containing protein, partial [Bacillota bacterium]|nr:carbohydrate binding domain-containing protein [Bacillota bacterium]